MARTKPKPPTSLQFFSQLKWLDGSPLLDRIEEYRRAIFTKMLDSFGADGRPLYNLGVFGRGPGPSHHRPGLHPMRR